jgi:hypothetical protein
LHAHAKHAIKIYHQLKVVDEMRSSVIAALVGLSLLPITAFAQTAPQTAAVESPTSAAPASPATAGITREQYIQRAQERATQRAGVRFDQMDTNHDGVIDRAEIRTWRNQHTRRTTPQPSQPAPHS